MKKEYKASEDQFKKLYPSPLQRRKDIGGAVLKTIPQDTSADRVLVITKALTVWVRWAFICTSCRLLLQYFTCNEMQGGSVKV